ncbi:MAG: hypothetical protein JNL43_03165 [Flavobacteriales bacterium]|nr:hypothetical protein [Flavobacteriales bacterium]
MKHMLGNPAFVGLFAMTNAQTSAKTTPGDDLVEHSCTAACPGEVHAYLHGQRGHPCKQTCNNAASNTAGCCASKKASASCAKGVGKGDARTRTQTDDNSHAVKDHACTTACTGGKHSHLCGEEGRACSATCQPKHLAIPLRWEDRTTNGVFLFRANARSTARGPGRYMVGR